MIGYGTNKGIVPMVTEEMFRRTGKENSKLKKFEVNVSMMEIYNEKIQDLLIPIADRPSTGLKIRESKTLGIYVEQLTKHPVDSYQSIQAKMDEGFRYRTIASTQMNATSSRAHTIISIEFKQIEFLMNHKVEKISVINLVDLAGSEKISKTGAVGDRLKEGCAINKSLSVLGMVITTLAENSQNKGKEKLVPFRDSSLTRILQNALGGNSKTLMICAISPSSDNYEETLSTLRYADQAKRIKCNAVINESESDHKIRELQKENDELKKIIASLKTGTGINFSNISVMQEVFAKKSTVNDEESNGLDRVAVLKKKVEEYEQNLKSNQMIIEEFERTFEEKLKEEQQKVKVAVVENDYTVPHLTNMNEDSQLSNKLFYDLTKFTNFTIGRKTDTVTPQIVLNSIGIQPKHARIQVESNGEFILFAECHEAIQFLTLNGERVNDPTRLNHLDRIGFGISTFFVFKNVTQADNSPQKIRAEEINWEFCQQEVFTKTCTYSNFQFQFLNNKPEIVKDKELLEIEVKTLKQELEEKVKKLNEEHQQTLEIFQKEILNKTQINENEVNEILKNETKKFKDYVSDLENEYHSKLEEIGMQKELFMKEKCSELKEKAQKKLQLKLMKIEPTINEVNLIAKDLQRKIEFLIDLNYVFVDCNDINEMERKSKYRIKVKVQNNELGYDYIWDLSKFRNRYFLIKELFLKFYETNAYPEVHQSKDPFWDPPDSKLIGQSYMRMFSLGYLIDNPCTCEIINENGVNGQLSLNLYPSDVKGQQIDENDPIMDEFDDDPKFLLNRSLYFVVEIL